MKEQLDLDKAIVQKLDNDILVTKYKDGVEILEEDAQEIDATHLTMAQGKDMFIIVDFMQGEVKINKSAEEFFIYKGKMMPFTKALAIVTPNKSSIISKIFSKPKKALYPTQEFSNVDEAKNWFSSLR